MLRADYQRLIKAGRSYKRALRSADSLQENKVPDTLVELKSASLALAPPDPEKTESATDGPETWPCHPCNGEMCEYCNGDSLTYKEGEQGTEPGGI